MNSGFVDRLGTISDSRQYKGVRIVIYCGVFREERSDR